MGTKPISPMTRRGPVWPGPAVYRCSAHGALDEDEVFRAQGLQEEVGGARRLSQYTHIGLADWGSLRSIHYWPP